MKVGDKVRVIGRDEINGYSHGFKIGDTGVIRSIDLGDGGIDVVGVYFDQWMHVNELEIAQ
jgi:hypothetical protein